MLKGPRFSHLGPFIFLSLVHQLEFHWSTNLPTNFSGVPTNYFREPLSESVLLIRFKLNDQQLLRAQLQCLLRHRL